jgi:hypothetical protein
MITGCQKIPLLETLVGDLRSNVVVKVYSARMFTWNPEHLEIFLCEAFIEGDFPWRYMPYGGPGHILCPIS